jgi:hypothetical protein
MILNVLLRSVDCWADGSSTVAPSQSLAPQICSAKQKDKYLANLKELATNITYYQCHGSGSVSGSELDPDSMGPWIRIRIRIRNPDPGGQKWPTNTDKS